MATRKRQTVQELVTESQMQVIARDTDKMPQSQIPDDIAIYMDLLRGYDGISSIQRRFLGAFAICGIVSRACQAVGIPTRNHYRWLKDSAEYREVFAEASRISNEYLEGLALELASGMRTKPVVSMGKIVTYEPIYDTRLLSTLLKARMPEKYGNKVDVTSGGQPIVKVIDRDTYDAI